MHHNADRIRGGQYLLSGQDNTGIYDADYQDPFFTCKNVTVEKMYELAGYRYEGMNFGRNIYRIEAEEQQKLIFSRLILLCQQNLLPYSGSLWQAQTTQHLYHSMEHY